MKPEIQAFLENAPALGLLTDLKVRVLKELCSDEMTFDDFVELVAACHIVPADCNIRDVIASISAPHQGAGGARSAEEELTWKAPLDVDWFCYLAVAEGLLTEEACLILTSVFEEASGLMEVAQFLFSGGESGDMGKIQDLVDRATKNAEAGERPPRSVFRRSAS